MPVPVLDNQLQIYDFKGLHTARPKDMIADEEFSVLTNCLVRKGSVRKRMGIELKKDFGYNPAGTGAAFAELLFMGVDTGFGVNNVATFYFYDVKTFEIFGTRDFVNVQKRSGPLAVNFVSSSLINSIDLGPYFLGSVNSIAGIYRMPDWFNPAANPTLISDKVSGYSGDIFTHQDRMWWYGGVTLAFSNPGDFSSIDVLTANHIELPNNIDAAAPIGDKIVLSTMEGVFILNIAGAPRGWSLTKISATTKGWSITETTRSKIMIRLDDFLYFLTPEGFWRTDGTNIEKLSEPIENEFDEPIKPFPDSINVGIFSRRHKEILVKFPGNLHDDVNNQIKYYVFSAKDMVWSKLELALTTPPTAPIFTPPANTNYEGMPFYTYDLISMFGVYANTTLDFPASWTTFAQGLPVYDFARDMQGMYCMTNWVSNEPNKLYFFPEYDDEQHYTDAGNKFVSKLETKTFDLGYRGAHKKVNKCFFTLDTDDDVDFSVSYIINGITGAVVAVERTIDENERLVKARGPGYFLEYSIVVQDNILPASKVARWEIQSFGMDIMNKSEQVHDIGR